MVLLLLVVVVVLMMVSTVDKMFAFHLDLFISILVEVLNYSTLKTVA